MTNKKKYFPIILVNAIIFALLLLLRNTGLLSLKIHDISPLLPLALLVALSVFADETASAFTGLAVGIMLDSVSSAPIGYNAAVLMTAGLFASLISNHIFNKNIRAAVALCVLAALYYYIIRWIICDIWVLNFYENIRYFLRYIIPQSLYTTIFVFPFYFLEKKLFKITDN